MRRWLGSLGLLLPLAVPGTAWAEDDGCPPGAWFCEEVEVQPPPLEEAEGAEAAPARPARPRPPGKGRPRPQREITVDGDSPVVIVKEEGAPDPQIVVVERRASGSVEPGSLEPPPPPAPKKARRRWRETFGLNLRLQGAAYPAATESLEDEAGMGGLGLSFRWRPSPYFAFDVGADVMGGTDYAGYDRIETALSGSGIVYFNPQHRVQVYGIGGLHVAHAEVERYQDVLLDGWTWSDGSDNVEHDYVGGHAGIGVEFRVSRLVGLHLDMLGIVRTRVSDGPAEFVSPSGQVTDTSGAGVFRGGVTFWW